MVFSNVLKVLLSCWIKKSALGALSFTRSYQKTISEYICKLWLFLNSKDHNYTIIKAVNLGNDTDTVSAITGGLLGIHYGYEKINNEWKKTIKDFSYMEKMCEDLFATKLEKSRANKKLKSANKLGYSFKYTYLETLTPAKYLFPT